MLLGKRPRPPMRRTTSLAEFAAPDVGKQLAADQEKARQQQRERMRLSAAHGEEGLVDVKAAAAPPPPRGKRSSGDFALVPMAPFLKACGLCKRSLGSGRDIFMYRGDIAFCSLECRQQKINLDERNEKRSLSSIKKGSLPVVATVSEASNNGETVAAA